MKKRVFAIVTVALVLIGLIFFTIKVYPKEKDYEGVLVQEEYLSRWQEI